MSKLCAFSELIPERKLSTLAAAGEELPLAAIASLAAAIRADGTSILHNCVHDTLVRLVETHLLSHPHFARLVTVWDSILGTAEERIRDHLLAILGEAPSEALVRHIFRCISGAAARRGRDASDHDYYLSSVLERIARESSNKQLRCESCGYHFRVKDLNPDRVRLALDAGLQLEKYLFPGRTTDPYKPIQFNEQKLTTLTIDHIVPRETFGWTDSDNLEIVCAFCNFGKLAYRRPLEALSTFAVGSLADTPRGRPFNRLKHQIVVAALASQGGLCADCGASKTEAELTVRFVSRPGEKTTQGFAPWNLRTTCYSCLAKALESEVAG